MESQIIMESFGSKEDIMESLQKRLKRDEDEYVKHQGKFKQFDVIMNDDHFFVLGDEDDHSKKLGGEEDFRTKKIMEDWRILKEGLPHTIFVRGYVTFTHLLRAVIVGEEGTPFHDGLFFFDIKFPSSYPNEPPVVTYHSYGFRLHPDLEWDGEVRLSLLNTSRKKNPREKKWKTDTNVLEVLVSIQERIVHSKPYFDKPGKRMLPKWFHKYLEKKSCAYNQETFVVNCKTMLEVIQKPPKDFEFFVEQHFRDRAETILRACLAYKLASSKVQVSIDALYSRFYHAFLKMGLTWSTF